MDRSASDKKLKLNKNPYAEASFLSRRTFLYLRHTFKTAHKRPLDDSDIFQTLDGHKGALIGDQFTALWNQQLERKKPHLLQVIHSIYGLKLMGFGFLFGVLEIISRIGVPLCLGELITYFTDRDEDGVGTLPRESAYYYASGIVIFALIPVVTFHPFFIYVLEMGMKIRVGCSAMIYKKVLQFSKYNIFDGINGQVINFLSNDMGKIEVAPCFLHDLWKGPVEAAILFYFIYREIGLSSIIGVVFMLCSIPFQAWVGKKAATYRLRIANRTDKRVRFMNEIIQGIQVIKMYTWENSFVEIVDRIRREETSAIKGSLFIQAALISLQIVGKLALFLSLVAFVYFGTDPVTARRVFVVSSLYATIRQDFLNFWALAITVWAESLVSLTRITDFLLTNETRWKTNKEDTSELPQKSDLAPEIIFLPQRTIRNYSSSPKSVQLRNASAKWDRSSVFKLAKIDLNLIGNGLNAIVGPVGCGKSTLLNLIAGELPISEGSIHINGTLSYASQEPWLFEGSIRKNIVFIEDFNEARYQRVVKACALEKDINGYTHGDRTIVGERGVRLSGGQRARINLARAVYKKAEIYLLDDPLSAVDSQVGKHIFEQCLRDFLGDKLILLVTHQLKVLQDVESVVVLNGGKVDVQGSYQEIKGNVYLKSMISVINDTMSAKGDEDVQDDGKIKDKGKPEEDLEVNSVGSIKLDTYNSYLKSIKSPVAVIFTLSLFVFGQVAINGTDLFLALWTTWEESLESKNSSVIEGSGNSKQRQSFIVIYSVLIVLSIWLVVHESFAFFKCTLRASIYLHDLLFRGIIRARMSFFNNNASGRILNRFSKDIGSIDTQLPMYGIEVLKSALEMIGILVIVSIVNYWLLLPIIVMLILFYFLRKFYMNAGRSIKRIVAQTSSPLFAHVNATLQGLSTIRVSKSERKLEEEFCALLDHNSSAFFLYITSTRAFAFWLDLICVIYIAVVTYSFLVLDVGTATGGNVGLAISQVIGLVGLCQWSIRQFSELENQMISAERVMEYANLHSEPPLATEPKNLPFIGWPDKGSIEFQAVNLRYSVNGEVIMKNFNLHILSKEQIGIVGRTGAGKSSIIQALFRLAHTEGTIKIDGIDLGTLGLHDLRRNISIIPQDPVLFAGTLRSNLDPFEKRTDEELWMALQSVELKEAVGGLDCRITDGGANFSLGQRQLICLARAILCKNRILILDEATANVDPETDQLIQRTIRSKFADCTVLTIAHRLDTIIDSDRVIVMDGGEIVEFDSPYNLLTNVEGPQMFKSMVMEGSNGLYKHILNRRVNRKMNYDQEG